MAIYLSFPVELDVFKSAILNSLDAPFALDFIGSIDLAFADAGFTESVIFDRVRSLKGDLTPEDREALVKEIAEILEVTL